MSYPNEFNLGGNCLKRLAGKKYATMAFERSSCAGILWNVFRAETGFPRSLSEICEQIYCHVLIHPGCYLSKCSLLHVYERNAEFTLSLIHSGMFDDHQSDDNPKKSTEATRSDQIKLFDHPRRPFLLLLHPVKSPSAVFISWHYATANICYSFTDIMCSLMKPQHCNAVFQSGICFGI